MHFLMMPLKMKIDFIIFVKIKGFKMRAIEIQSKTDKNGHLRVDYQLDKSNSNVRILILVDDSYDENEEKIWMDSITSNPAFDFLNDPAEDIYSIKDGDPFND